MTPREVYVAGPRGEVRIETGVGRVVRLKPTGAESPYIELTIKAPPLVKDVTGWCDRRRQPFCDLFADGLGSFARATVDVDFEYRVEVHRQLGVSANLPLEKLDRSMKRRRLVDLHIAGQQHQAPVPVDESEWTTPDADPIGDTLRAGFAHLPGPAAPTKSGDADRPVAAPPDWVPFDGLLRYARHNIDSHLQQRGPGGAALQDQVAATVREWLIEDGVDVNDEHVMRSVFAGAALVHRAGEMIDPVGRHTDVAVRQALCGLVLNMPAGSKASAA